MKNKYKLHSASHIRHIIVKRAEAELNKKNYSNARQVLENGKWLFQSPEHDNVTNKLLKETALTNFSEQVAILEEKLLEKEAAQKK